MHFFVLFVLMAAGLAVATPVVGTFVNTTFGLPLTNKIQSDDQDWIWPCFGWSFDHNQEGLISATCPDRNANEGRSTLDLNHCLANVFGLLRWREEGNAFLACRRCSISEAYGFHPRIHCECPIGLGDRTYAAHQDISSVDGGQVDNHDGRLACYSAVGSRE